MGFQDSWLNISVSSLVILAASIVEISCGKIDAAENHNTTTAVGFGNGKMKVG